MYRYACLKPPRNCVRRASGLVLTRLPETNVVLEFGALWTSSQIAGNSYIEIAGAGFGPISGLPVILALSGNNQVAFQ
jgi:hypothetical protein